MDSLSIIIVLLIIGIVLDGVRRVRKARREGMELSRRVGAGEEGQEVRVSQSEFPSGGARVAGSRETDDAEELNENVRKAYEDSKTTMGAPAKEPEQAALNLEDVVPMLMDSIEAEPALGDMDTLGEADEASTTRTRSAEPSIDKSEMQSENTGEVLIISIMAKTDQFFQGSYLLEVLVSLHMKFGEMDIFHRHAEENGDGPILFSLVNMLVPGTFNLAEMADFQSPGVSLFMRLPVAGESLQVFDIMAKTARSLATELDGELKDENRSVMTSQTFEHYRQRVVEFERQQKLHHA